MILFVVIAQRSLARSPQAKSLCRPAARIFTPGPLMTPLPEVPNWPSVGGANEFGLNHAPIVCEPVLGLLRIFGRSVTVAGSLEVYSMPTGSSPVQNGVRNMPLCAV